MSEAYWRYADGRSVVPTAIHAPPPGPMKRPRSDYPGALPRLFPFPSYIFEILFYCYRLFEVRLTVFEIRFSIQGSFFWLKIYLFNFGLSSSCVCPDSDVRLYDDLL